MATRPPGPGRRPPTAQRGSRVPYGASANVTPASGEGLPAGSTRSSSAPIGRPTREPILEWPARAGSRCPTSRRRSSVRPRARPARRHGRPRSERASRSAARALPAGRGGRRSASARATSCSATRSASRSAMIPAIRAEAVAVDVPPPGRRERLTRTDRGPDVPCRDPDVRHAAADPRAWPLLDRTREQSLHEEPLQAEEHEERDHHQQECAGGEQMPLGPVLGEQVLDRLRSSGTSRSPATKTRAISRSFQTHRNWKIP